MSISEMYQFNKAARLLTRKKVWLYWRNPARPGLLGEVTKSNDVFYITIRPDLDPEKRLEVFLHQLSVIVLRGNFMDDLKLSGNTLGKRSLTVQEVEEQKQAEEDMSALAERWMAIAEREAVILTPFRKLEALVKFYEVKPRFKKGYKV